MQYRFFLIILLTLIFGMMDLAIDVKPASAAPMGIINGVDVNLEEQRGVVGLLLADVDDLYNAQFCGGTLIDAEWVLTAAHCTFDLGLSPFAPTELDVIVGSHRLYAGFGERIAVDRIVRHPNFDFATYHNDIALLHLATPVSKATVAIADDTVAPEVSMMTGVVLGWGVMDNGYGATTLQQAELPLVTQESCAALYAKQGYQVTDSMLCAGYLTGGIDACAGDSGGPLMIWNEDDRNWVQIGIISAGAGCAEPGYVGLYTRLSDFSQWISTAMQSEFRAFP